MISRIFIFLFFLQIRGKKWVPPPKPKDNNFGLGLDDSIELDIDLGDETEKALIGASTSDIIDLAGMIFLKICNANIFLS